MTKDDTRSVGQTVFTVARWIWRAAILIGAILLVWYDSMFLIVCGVWGLIIGIGYFHYLIVGGWPSPRVRWPFETAYFVWNWRLTEIRWLPLDGEPKTWWDRPI